MGERDPAVLRADTYGISISTMREQAGARLTHTAPTFCLDTWGYVSLTRHNEQGRILLTPREGEDSATEVPYQRILPHLAPIAGLSLKLELRGTTRKIFR